MRLMACLLFLLLVSCASYAKKLDKTTIQDIADGKIGAIVISLQTEKIPCNYAVLSFQNIETNRYYGTGLLVSSWNKKKNVKLLAVPSGRYKTNLGFCTAETPSGKFQNKKETRFNGIDLAYAPFEVRNGEVVYPGTFSVVRHNGISLLYEITDLSADKKRGVSKSYPTLADTFTVKISRTINSFGTIHQNTTIGSRN